MNDADKSLMLFLNFDGGSVMDSVMWFASGIASWIPLYLVILFIIYRTYGWKYMLFALLFIGLGIGICDQVCNYFKRTIEYLRPTHTESLLPFLHTVREYHGGLTGTVSGHASTSMCICLFTSLVVRKRWFSIMMLAYTLIISYSRIYLGVHYPFQILFGWTLGLIVAPVMWLIFRNLNKRYHWDNTPSAQQA